MKETIERKNIIITKNIQNKEQLFHYLAEYMVSQKEIDAKHQEAFEQALWSREQLSVTGVGNDVAIPHVQKEFITRPIVIFLKSETPIAYESIEGDSVRLIFMIAVPEHASAKHLNFLAELSRKLMDDDFRKHLLEASDVDALYHIISEWKEKGITKMESKGKLLAVTACPTGIAHTYMAAENIEKAAKAMHYEIKVETNGSSGAENVLTQKEKQEADAILIAADTKVAMTRFHGKRVYQTTVSQGIKEPEAMIAQALKAPLFEAEKEEAVNIQGGAHGIYTHLMSGVSNMIPLVVGGGILIAISFL